MKLAIIVGTRPNLIKYAALYPYLISLFQVLAIDTQQHYARELASDLWREFELPEPVYSLGISSVTHACQTAEMLVGIEKILFEEKPSAVVVFGDTNSALAGSLASAKLPLPVIHIEAGARTTGGYLPEEVNRVIIDHISSLLFCIDRTSVRNLHKEGIRRHVYLTGDLLFELLGRTVLKLSDSDVPDLPSDYLLLTIHRAENTTDSATLLRILNAVGSLGYPVLFPIHPRSRKVLSTKHFAVPSTIRFLDPVGYTRMIELEQKAFVVLTDSGGVQREAFYLGKPCLVLRDGAEWPELLKQDSIRLVGTKEASICEGFAYVSNTKPKRLKWKHDIGKKIVEEIISYLTRG